MMRFILAVLFMATIASNADSAAAYTPVIACESHGSGLTRITIATFADDVMEDETALDGLVAFVPAVDNAIGVYTDTTCAEVIAGVRENIAAMRGR